MSKEMKKLDDAIKELKNKDITLENLKHQDPQGVGDTVANVLSMFGITEEWIDGMTGNIGGCGCAERKQFLNKIFPYRHKAQKKDSSNDEPNESEN